MASKKGFALGINFARIARQMKMERQFISDTKIRIISPGFPYEAFNGKAQIHPWGLLRMVEYARCCAYSQLKEDDKCYLDVEKIYPDYMLFINATKTEISPQFYDSSIIKGPLEMTVELINVGRTSGNLRTSMFLPEVRGPVCVNEVQSVFVSLKERKPSSPPQWWLKKYASGPEGKGSPLILDRHIAPLDGKFLMPPYFVKINASDIDTYLHTNWTQYIRFGYDALVNHAITQLGTQAGIDMAFRKFKKFFILYLREAKLMDELTVRLWKQSESKDIFKLQFVRGSDIICEVEIELYPGDDN